MTILGDFNSYVASLSPAVYIAPVTGDFSNRDSYGNVISYIGSPYIKKTGDGHGLIGGTVSVAHGTEQLSTSGTLFLLSSYWRDVPASGGNQRIISKRSVGDIQFDLRLSTPASNPYIYLYDGTFDRFLLHSFEGARSIAVTFTDGVTPKVFHDGAPVGVMSGTSSISTSAQPVNIAAFYDGTQSSESDIQVALYFPSVISDKQVSDLHELCLRIRVDTSTSKLSPPGARPPVPNNVLILDGEKRGMTALDSSGNGIDFAFASSAFVEENTPGGKGGFRGFGGISGEAYLSVTNSLLDNVIPFSCAFWMLQRSAGEAGSGRLYVKGNTLLAIYCTASGGGSINFADRWNGGALVTWNFQPDGIGRWHFVCIKYSGASGEKPEASINGSAFAEMTGSVPSGSRDDDTDVAYLLDSSSRIREFDGVVDDFQIFNTLLTDDDAKSLYLRSALRTKRLAHSTEYPTSLSNVVSGFVGPWERQAGTWRWTDDGTKRVLVAVSAGTATIRSQQAYGGWYFKLNKAVRSSWVFSMLTASVPEIYTDSSQNGYMFGITNLNGLRIYRVTAGSAEASPIATADDTIDAGTEYEYFSTYESGEGIWSLFVKGGAYTNWTLLDTGIDTTHLTSSFMTAQFQTAGDSISDVVFFPFGDGINPAVGDLDTLRL